MLSLEDDELRECLELLGLSFLSLFLAGVPHDNRKRIIRSLVGDGEFPRIVARSDQFSQACLDSEHLKMTIHSDCRAQMVQFRNIAATKLLQASSWTP